MATIFIPLPGQPVQQGQPQGENNAQGTPAAYTPVIKTAEDSTLIVLNDNCILSLDAVLSISGIGKVLSHRGHELYTLYSATGTICEFEGTGLMQRTVEQVESIQKRHADRKKNDANEQIEKLQRQVDALWYLPGNPGAQEAESDFIARKEDLDRPRKKTH